MLSGVALFLSFTALFAKTVIEPEIEEVEQEMRKVEKEIHDLRSESQKESNDRF